MLFLRGEKVVSTFTLAKTKYSLHIMNWDDSHMTTALSKDLDIQHLC